ncbi:hypothetical protein SASPL_117054 [Salvia splendens]|uniref:Charged multivesicular body protein 2A n=1 Tax=Salvia splendens TaxID=180675 RepID=A0A8X8ZXE7_SALSN|nr:hypothetical protein SASPL_117054 [Salvia splendens]
MCMQKRFEQVKEKWRLPQEYLLPIIDFVLPHALNVKSRLYKWRYCLLKLFAICNIKERRLVAEIKKTAKTGNEASFNAYAATKILARQLVRLRQQITNLQGSRAQMRGVETHTQALYASTSISTGMKGATKAMSAMNKQMQPAKQTKMIREFQQQAAQMDMTIEMMSDAIDETLDKDEAEEETEELTNQVLDEIGVDIASQLSSAPKGHIASKKVENTAPSAAVSTDDVEDLEKRLASLRRI